MEVRLFATLRPIVGGPVVQLQTEPGASVRTLLDEMIARYPAMQNGRDVRYVGGLDVAIPEGASIRIFPPVGGGRHA